MPVKLNPLWELAPYCFSFVTKNQIAGDKVTDDVSRDSPRFMNPPPNEVLADKDKLYAWVIKNQVPKYIS